MVVETGYCNQCGQSYTMPDYSNNGLWLVCKFKEVDMSIEVQVTAKMDRLQSMQSAYTLAQFLSNVVVGSGDDVTVSYNFNGTEVLVSTSGLVSALLENEPNTVFYTLWAERNSVKTVEVPKGLDEVFSDWFKENGSEELYVSRLPVDLDAVTNMLKKAFHFAYWHGWDESKESNKGRECAWYKRGR